MHSFRQTLKGTQVTFETSTAEIRSQRSDHFLPHYDVVIKSLLFYLNLWSFLPNIQLVKSVYVIIPTQMSEKLQSAAENSPSFLTYSTITYLYFLSPLLFPLSLLPHNTWPPSAPLFFWACFVHFFFTFPALATIMFQPREQSVQVAFKECFELRSDNRVESVLSPRLSCSCIF